MHFQECHAFNVVDCLCCGVGVSCLDVFSVMTICVWSMVLGYAFQAFRIIHQLVRREGLIINMVPAAGCWAKHGAVDYEPRFFQALAGQDQGVETYLVNAVKWSAPRSCKPCQHLRDNQGSYHSAGCAQHWLCSLRSIRQCMSHHVQVQLDTRS